MKQLNKLIPLLILILGLTPLIWFIGKGNVLINGVDTNFPLDQLVWFERRLFVWDAVTNAGRDFSSSTAGLFFHFIQVIPYSLGFNLQITQIFSLVFWFALIVFGSFIFARVIFPGKFLIQLLFVVLYSFNIYLFNAWENVKVANLSLVAAIPFALTVLLKLQDKKFNKIKASFFAALTGILVSGTGINPAYMVSFFLVLFIFVLSQIITEGTFANVFDRIRDFMLISIIIILVNLFWILPTIHFIINTIPSRESISEIGFTNWVDSLSKNTNLLNVLRLQGAWDWYAFDEITGLPLYIPYALRYLYSFPFIAFSFLLAGLAILSLIFRDDRKKTLYIFFGPGLIIGVFLGAGTYPPTGEIYRFLLEKVPFFSLFRSPWYIFTPLTFISLAGLAGLLFYRFANFKIIVYSLAAVFIIGHLFYSYPLISGKIFRPAQSSSFFVNFPDYLFEARDYLKESEIAQGRIIGYPEDEIERFNWGYIGIESILSLFSGREIISTSLNSPDSPLSNVLKEFYTHLKKGNLESARSLAAKLNASVLFEKKDQSSLSGDISQILNPFKFKSIGEWNFYNLSEKNNLKKIFTTDSYIFSTPYNSSEKIFALTSPEDLILNHSDSVISGIRRVQDTARKIYISKNSHIQEYENFAYSPSKLASRLVLRDFSKVEFALSVPEEGVYIPVLERYKVEDFGIAVEGRLEVEMDGAKTLWEVDKVSDAYVYFKKVNITQGEHKVVFKLKNENLVFGGDLKSGETFKRGGYGEGLGEYAIKEDDLGKYLEIFNVGRANVSADFAVARFDPFIPYYIQLRYKQIYGNNGTVVVTQGNKTSLVKAQVERLPNYPQWNYFSFFYEPVQTESLMEVNLEAPFTVDPLGTRMVYSDLKVHKLFTNNLIFMEEVQRRDITPTAKVEMKKISPVEYSVTVEDVKGPHTLVFLENYSPNWEVEIKDEENKRIKSSFPHFSANLYANAWYVENTPNNYRATIYYKPQKLYSMGMIISLLTLLVISGLFVRTFLKKRQKI